MFNKQVKRAFTTAILGHSTSAALKLIFGVISGSIALVADGVHSLFDVASSIIGRYTYQRSVCPPDADHPYGHGKYEFIGVITISLLILFAAAHIILEASTRIISGSFIVVTPPILGAALLAASISFVVSMVERRAAKVSGSKVLLADAFHALSDVLSALVVFAALLGVNFNLQAADPVAAFVVCGIMVYLSARMFRAALYPLVDTAAPMEVVQKIHQVACSVQGVKCHAIRTRKLGESLYVDMHIMVNDQLPVKLAHELAHSVVEAIKREIPAVQDVVVHIEPSSLYDSETDIQH